MSGYRVYQLSLREVGEEINLLGWEAAAAKYPVVAAHLAATFEEEWRPEYASEYKRVASVVTEGGLERVFALLNSQPAVEGEVVHYVGPAHSMSVGDLVKTNDDETYIVRGVGFEKVEVS